jgi:hypothetical protein
MFMSMNIHFSTLGKHYKIHDFSLCLTLLTHWCPCKGVHVGPSIETGAAIAPHSLHAEQSVVLAMLQKHRVRRAITSTSV